LDGGDGSSGDSELDHVVIGDGGNTSAFTVADALAENQEPHEEPGDYSWDEGEVIPIVLADDGIVAPSDGVVITDGTVAISAGGTYELTGSLSDGRIVVETQDESTVRLILNGVDIRSTTSAPIAVLASEKTVIFLADGSVNHLADAADHAVEEDVDATIFSKDDLSISGTGSLTVDGNFNDGIACSDGLVIHDGNVYVTAVDDGVRGKDYVVVRGGVTVSSRTTRKTRPGDTSSLKTEPSTSSQAETASRPRPMR